MTDDNQLSFNLPSVSRKKVTAAFDGGRLSSDAGVMLLALAERCRKVADTLAAHIADRRDPLRITHTVADVLRARMLAIGCGYPDGNDFDWLRRDAAFKLACGRLPDTEVLRGFAETRYAAKSWDKERRVVARIEASASHADDMLRRGIDIRYVVTSLPGSDAEHIYETIYCARGQAENLIKQHKAQLASDRTSCRSPLANQMRLILHTGAYWLLQSAAAHRVRYDPSASLENRRTFHRAREPHSYRARLMLPGGRDVQSCRAQAATVRTISSRGDDAPPSPDPLTPNASTAFSTQSICRRYARRNG